MSKRLTKAISLLLSLVMITLSLFQGMPAIASEPDSTNLVANPEFEQGSAEPWTKTGNAQGTFSVETTKTHTGSQAGKVTGRTQTFAGISQDITAALKSSGKGQYTASVWAALGSGTGNVQIQLYIWENGAAAERKVLVAQGLVGTEYALVSGTKNITWNGTLDKATIEIRTSDSKADLYADDVKLAATILEITGAGPAVIPSEGNPANTYTFGKALKDKLGNEVILLEIPVNWSIRGTYEGVSLDQAGILSVTSNTSPGSIVIRGTLTTDATIYAEKTVHLISADMAATPQKPEAKNVSVLGQLKPGRLLTADYEYEDLNGDEEAGTEIKWYSGASAQGPFTEIAEASGITYIVNGSYLGKYIQFGVTPKNNAAEESTGDTVYSEAGMVVQSATPTAINVSIGGLATEGREVTGIYTYQDADGDPEAGTVYKWLISDTVDGAYTYIDGAVSKTLTVTPAMTGKYLKFEVTPADAFETGIAYISDTSSKVERSELAPPVKYEAENAVRAGGTGFNTNHTGFSGTGFVDSWAAEGASLTFTVNMVEAGEATIGMRYANAHSLPNTLSLYVNGTFIRQISLPTTGSWDIWTIAFETLQLNEGSNTIAYKMGANDSGHVNIDYITIEPLAIPLPWQHRDIGNVSFEGSALYKDDAFTVEGNGENVYNTADAFHYVYQVVKGDSSITARVESMENTATYAKAGVMIRETLNADSKNAYLNIAPTTAGIAFQRRLTAGAATTASLVGNLRFPYWLKLVRTGDIFTAYYSADGISWTQHGQPVQISMSGEVYIGLAVCATNANALNESRFTDVQVETFVTKNLLTKAISSEIGENHAEPQYVLKEQAYSSDSWLSYTSAIAEGIALELDSNAAQEAVDAAILAIEAAKKALVPVLTEVREFYVDPEAGSDTNPGTQAEPFKTIEKARDAIRNAPKLGSVTVWLMGGEYNYAGRPVTTRTETFTSGSYTGSYTIRTGQLTFDERDSAPQSYEIAYKAYPGETPVVSGGKQVTGWEIADTSKNIYKAYVGTGINTRQFYVNGERAIVARSEGRPAGLTYEKAYGHNTTDVGMTNWRNPEDIEFVYYDQWVEFRIKVNSITNNGDGTAKIAMETFPWSFATADARTYTKIRDISNMVYFENAYELLDTQGEWYLDHSDGYIYYMPRQGEDMTTAEAVIPMVDELLSAGGTSSDNRLENIRFEGITFEYGGWTAPDDAGFYFCNGGVYPDSEPHGALSFRNVRGITLQGNEITRTGINGVRMYSGGLNDITISGNRFIDLSCGAMVIGDPGPNPIGLTDVTVTNNYILKFGQQYTALPAIYIAQGKHMRIAHNEVGEGPYNGICVANHNSNAITEDVVIEYNYFHDLCGIDEVFDTGVIYASGTNVLADYEHPAFTVQYNYIKNETNGVGALYPDNYSTWWLAQKNVIDLRFSPPWKGGKEPVVMLTNWGENLRFLDNYTTTDVISDSGKNNEYRWLLYPDAIWPSEAINIITEAGLEEEYQYLADKEHQLNQVLNPGFETRQDDEVWKAVNAQWNRTVLEHNSEGWSAKVTPSAAGGHIYQTIDIKKGLNYQVSAWIKPAGSDVTATLYAVIGEGEAAETIALNESALAVGEWTRLEGTLSYTGGEVTVPAKLYVQTNSNQVYYIDDFYAIEAEQADRSLLESAISDAQDLYDQAVEGGYIGNYNVGSKAELAAVIAFAQNVLDNSSASAKEIFIALKKTYANYRWFEAQKVSTAGWDALGVLIGEADQLYNSAVEGELVGLYVEGSKAVYGAAINSAKTVHERLDASNQEYLDAATALKAAMETFKSKKIALDEDVVDYVIGYAGLLLNSATEGTEPGQYAPGSKAALESAIALAQQTADAHQPVFISAGDYIVNQADWSADSEYTVASDSATILGRALYMTEKYSDEIFSADISFTYAQEWNYPGFYLRKEYPLGVPSTDEEMYFLCFKKTGWELQKLYDGNLEMLIGYVAGRNDPRWGVIPNTQIKGDGSVQNIIFGAQNVAMGVRLFAMVDGVMVFDKVDTINPITNPGYFGIASTSVPMTVYFDGTSQESVEAAYNQLPRQPLLVNLKSAYDGLLAAIDTFEAGKVQEPAPSDTPTLDMIFAIGGVKLSGSAKITGNVGTGAEYDRNYPMPQFPAIPELENKGSFTAEWRPEGSHIINKSGAYDSITVDSQLSINIGDEDVRIVTKNLSVKGSGNITVNRIGAGKLILYVTDKLEVSGSGSINKNGNSDGVVIYYAGSSVLNFGGSAKISSSIFAREASMEIGGSAEIIGNIVTGGRIVNINGSAGTQTRVVYAPNAVLSITGSGRIQGMAVAKNIVLSGTARIIYDDSINLDFFEQLDW